MRRFKHLSKSDRIRIETLNNDGKTPKEIAEVVGVHISTIYRELQRGQYTHRNSDWTEETRSQTKSTARRPCWEKSRRKGSSST